MCLVCFASERVLERTNLPETLDVRWRPGEMLKAKLGGTTTTTTRISVPWFSVVAERVFFRVCVMYDYVRR